MFDLCVFRFLFGIVKFSEIIVVPSKKALLLDEVAPCLLNTHFIPFSESIILDKLTVYQIIKDASFTDAHKTPAFQVPQIMRNQLYGCLHQLGPNLTRLNLGSGSGGSCSTVNQFHCHHHRQSILLIVFLPMQKKHP